MDEISCPVQPHGCGPSAPFPGARGPDGSMVVCMSVLAAIASAALLAGAGAAPTAVRDVPMTFSAPGGPSLAGTLTLPAGPGPHPAAVFVGGFGPSDRDGATGVFGRRAYPDWATTLARRGVAVLRYDKRGIGDSAGPDLAWLDPRPLSADAVAAVRALRARPEVDPGRLTLVGHSQGGNLALRAAVLGAPVRAVVTLASPGRPLGRLTQTGTRTRVLLALLVGDRTAGRLLRADPRRDSAAVPQPVLMIHGTADGVVPAGDARRLARARAAVGAPTRVRLFPGLDHYLQDGSGRTPPGLLTLVARMARTGELPR